MSDNKVVLGANFYNACQLQIEVINQLDKAYDVLGSNNLPQAQAIINTQREKEQKELNRLFNYRIRKEEG